VSMVTCPATVTVNLKIYQPSSKLIKSKYRTQNASNPDHKENGYRNVIRQHRLMGMFVCLFYVYVMMFITY